MDFACLAAGENWRGKPAHRSAVHRLAMGYL